MTGATLRANSNSADGTRRLIGHSSVYAIGLVVRQVVGFLMLPIYTRYLTPSDYGAVSLMAFAIAAIEPFLGARLGSAIPKYYADTPDSSGGAKVITTAIIFTGAVSAITASALILFRQFASRCIFGSTEFATVVSLFAVLLFTEAMEYYVLTYLRLQQRPWLFLVFSLIKLVVQLTLNVWLVVVEEMGVLGVALSTMLSASLYTAFLLIYAFRRLGWSFDLPLASKMVRFSWPLWLAGVASLYIASSNRYYLRVFGSLEEVGLFELAVKLSGIIPLLIWQPFEQYWQVECFRYYREGNDAIFRETFSFISAFLILSALAVALFASPVIKIMAGPSFYRAAEAVPSLALGTVFCSLVSFVNFSFLAVERTGIVSRNNYLTAAVVTALYIALIPAFGHVGAGLAVMLAQGIQFFMAYRASSRIRDMSLGWRPFARTVLIGGVTFWIAGIVAPEKLIASVIVKFLVFVFAAGCILFPLLQDSRSRHLLRALLPRRNPPVVEG